ncbi:MAG: hypothetical protein QOJ32_2487 [Frankiaceae bacterium]|jgi:transcriptional regulator with XRE-family HTH domain|nr:hypothetical protein [Frankiaceae bacterium]
MVEEVPRSVTLLAEAQQRSGLTPSRWAAKAGVSRALLHNYLRGRHQPSLAQVERLVEAAGLRLRLELEPAPTWIEPSVEGDLTPVPNRDRDAQARALLDALSLADAIPVRRPRCPLRYPLLRDLQVR